MKQILVIIIMNLILFASEIKNDLQYESSPYLLQHASNPIRWMPWGEKALLLAKKQNKAIYLSIGYSTCHWCHVMAKESFENEDIAKLFNKYFICIKVDREEMPHLDTYYQELYLKKYNRNGGWPLNVFLSSDKKPLYIASYIPPHKINKLEGLDTLLPRLARSDKLNIESRMKNTSNILKTQDTQISLLSLQNELHKSYDDIYGGFVGSLKFPEAQRLWLMLDVAQLTKDEQLLENYFDMLNLMALRGLYDHIDGGFFRYAVDSTWKIPHFEKMLYNQAELIPLYVKGYMLSSNELYKNVVVESIDMVQKRFTKNSLFYSASDADTNHKEGAYFTFSYEEIQDALSEIENKKEIINSFQITKNGNFNGSTHLNIYDIKRPKNFSKFNRNLKEIRKIKEYPFIDKKINTAWNAMMIESLFYAGVIDAKYIDLANKHLDALSELMFDKGELYHQTIITKKPIQKGLLEDYSFFIAALLSGYEADFDKSKLEFAVYLLSVAKDKFYKNETWYLSDDGFEVKANLVDKYYTSALGKMIQNILKIASLKNSFKYEKLAINTLDSISEKIAKYQDATPASARAFLMLNQKIITIKSSKINLINSKKEIYKIKYPYIITKEIDNKKYLACTMRSCFSLEDSIIKINNKILRNIH